MKVLIVIVVFLGFTKYAVCQSNKTLRDYMWGYVSSCYYQVKGGDGEGNDKPRVLEDTINGYLKVSGEWPTCGCGCTSIVGAYKKVDGSYMLLSTTSWTCANDYEIKSSENMEDIMPLGFGLGSFIDTSGLKNSNKFSVFYLRVEIPRIGRRTKISIKLVPIGLMNECPNNLCYSIKLKELKTKDYYYNYKNLDYLKGFVERVSLSTLFAMMNMDVAKLNDTEKNIIIGGVNGKDFTDKLKKLSKDLWYLHFRFKMNEKLKYKTLIMDWDSNDCRFKIINNERANPTNDFIDFIKESDFYEVGC